MAAKALSRDVLAVRRSRAISPLEGRESLAERLLLVNFGATETRVDDFGPGWHVLLDSGNATHVNARGVSVAARSATILARDRDQA